MRCSKVLAITLGVVLGLTAIVCIAGVGLGINKMLKVDDLIAEHEANFEAFYWTLFNKTEAFALEVKKTADGPIWQSTKEELHDGMEKFGKKYLEYDGAVLFALSAIVLLTCIFCSFVLCCKNMFVQITAIILNVLMVIAMCVVVALTWFQHLWENKLTTYIWAENISGAIVSWRDDNDFLVQSYNAETSETVTIVCKDFSSCQDMVEDYLMLNLQHLFKPFSLAFIFVLVGLVVLNMLSFLFARKRDEE